MQLVILMKNVALKSEYLFFINSNYIYIYFKSKFVIKIAQFITLLVFFEITAKKISPRNDFE